MNDKFGLAVTDFNQPLLVVKHGDSMIHLVPEFCRVDGVPESIRSSPMSMRDCLAVCRTDPAQKMKKISEAVGLLMQQQVFKDFELSIESNPIDLSN